MSAVHAAKHMRDHEAGDTVGQALPSQPLKDAADWAQAMLMAAPLVGYALIYYARWQEYAWLGVSSSLITVRLEDVLLVIVLMVTFGWTQLINWMQVLLGTKGWRIKAYRILHPLLILVVVVQGALIYTEASMLNAYSYGVIIHTVIQLILLLYISWLLAKERPREHHQAIRVICSLVLFVAMLWANIAHYSFHFGRYQYVRDDNAIVVGYDSQGRVIEKEIIGVSDNHVCVLKNGYRLKDISDKDISLVRFSHLTVENSSEFETGPDRTDAP